MATPAAVLQVLVEANTTAATADLRRFDAGLRRIDRSTATATTRTSSLGSATRTVGGYLGRAAIAAGSAAAAYISISQAKAAVETTENLAKTTAGLNRNLGLTTKEASRWGAVAVARGIDTKSLTMSFTTLSRQLVEAGRGSETATQAFKDIGITQKDLNRTNGDFNKQLLMTADAFGEAEGGAMRQQAAQKLLGRGYQTLLPLFAEGSKSLKEQLHWADEYGVTLNKRTIGPINDLIKAQRESKVAWLGLQVTFTQMVAPALKVANEQFQRLSRIMGNDKLTNAEKFERIGKIIGGWAVAAKDAFLKVLPKLVEEVGRRAPEVAKAFVEGFANSSAIGKLFLGGFLISKMGGAAVLTGLGTRMGALVGGGFAAGVLGVVAAAGIYGLLIPNNFDDRVRKIVKNITEQFADMKSDIVPSVQRIGAAAMQMGNRLRVTKNDFQTAAQGARVFSRELDDSADEVVKFERILDKKMDQVGDSIKDTGKIFEQFADKSAKVKDKVGGNFIGLASVVTHGLQIIIDNTNKALKGFGVKKISISLAGAGAAASDFAQGKQTGGVIVPGQGSGDKVPAMLEPGEVVWNRNAVAAMGGAARADRANKLIPRFAKGGKVGGMSAMISLANAFDRANEPYVWGGGHGDFLTSPTGVDCSGAVSAILHAGGLLQGAPMVSGALMNWGRPASGGEPLVVYANPGHTVMSLNGRTFGTSGSNPGGGAGWINAPGGSLAPGAKRTMDVAGAIASRIARVLLKGPDGPLKDLGQKALDRARNAANRFIASKMPAGAAGGGDWGQFGKLKRVTASEYSGGPTGAGGYLPGHNSFAELSNDYWNGTGADFSALGGLPMHTNLRIAYGNKSLIGEKRDVGAGGPGIGDTKRAIDLYYDTANKLGFSGLGIVGVSMPKKQRGGIIGLAGGGDPKKDGKPIHGSVSHGSTDPDFKRLQRVRRIIEQINAIVGERGHAAKIEETISRVEAWASLESSPGGSDLTPEELARQVELNKRLLELLTKARGMTTHGLRLSNRKPYSKLGDKQFKGPRNTLGQILTDLQGLTGKGGRIGDVRLHLAELGATTTGTTTAPIDISTLRSVIEAARYGVFDNQLPRFHSGGVYRSPPGRNEGAAILRDGETVSPAGAGVVVNNSFDFEGLDLIVTTTVNGEIAKRERLSHNRARQYQR